MLRTIVLGSALMLAGCGVEVAATGATVAANQAQQVQHAQRIKAQVQQQLDASMAAGAQRLEEAEQR